MTKPEKDLQNPEFHARLALLIGDEKPFAWAKSVGISKGAFTRVWNLGTIPGAEALLKIQKKTGCSIDWLLTGEEDALPRARSFSQVATGNGVVQAGGKVSGKISVGGQEEKPSSLEMQKFLHLFERYGSPGLLESFTGKLEQIKKMVEEG